MRAAPQFGQNTQQISIAFFVSCSDHYIFYGFTYETLLYVHAVCTCSLRAIQHPLTKINKSDRNQSRNLTVKVKFKKEKLNTKVSLSIYSLATYTKSY